jgi:hypothetical protein
LEANHAEIATKQCPETSTCSVGPLKSDILDLKGVKAFFCSPEEEENRQLGNQSRKLVRACLEIYSPTERLMALQEEHACRIRNKEGGLMKSAKCPHDQPCIVGPLGLESSQTKLFFCQYEGISEHRLPGVVSMRT